MATDRITDHNNMQIKKNVPLNLWKSPDPKVMHYELLPSGGTINSKIYDQELTRLQRTMEKNHPELANREDVVFSP